MHMQRILPVEVEKATGKVKEQLEQVRKRLHRVPNMHATMAGAPAVLDAYLAMSAALAHGSLEPELRTRVALTVAAANAAEYCLAAHTEAGRAQKIPDAELALAREAKSSNPHHQAALKFARAVAEDLGMVSDADMAAVRAAGYTDAQVLELTAAVAANLFTNYFNHVAATQPDFAPAAAKRG